MSAPISEQDLHAYADEQLKPSRADQVETWLAAHPERRGQIESWRAEAAGLRRLYDPVIEEPVPDRLIRAATAPRRSGARRLAAALAWVALGGVIGFVLRGDQNRSGLGPTASLPRQAAVAHAVFVPETRHPVEVGAAEGAHLVAWLSKRLGAKLDPPRLEEAGYRLMGGRLLPGEQGEVAQFMYESEAQNRLTLYIQPQSAQAGEVAFRYARENGIDVFYWIEGRFGYALSGSTGREDMFRLATLVYRQQAK